jgi:hypothetical protein
VPQRFGPREIEEAVGWAGAMGASTIMKLIHQTGRDSHLHFSFKASLYHNQRDLLYTIQISGFLKY